MEFTARKRLIVLPLLLVVLFVLNISLGSVLIPFGDVLSILAGKEGNNPVWFDIVWDFRMTKGLTCVLAGSALAIAGLLMQTLFRNALAGPDVLGLSSGASLAVSLIFMSQASGLQLISSPSPWAVVTAASIGCGLVFIIVLGISHRLNDNTSLLIIGLMIGATASSLVSVLEYLSKAEDQQSFLMWTFGSLGGLNWKELQVLAIALIIARALAISLTKSLNAWFLGENYSRSLGVNTRLSRVLIILSACLLTGAVTAFCGPIAFVGLAVPHLTKLLIKTNNHRVLIPAVTVAGAALMLFCDIIAQLPGSSYILPINAITALIGAPVVISIIIKAKRITV
ncbi:MAG TPA: iron ABC transporter permease [Chryseolinea sp.]|nr:iron ABC transporter permease [Chryseolinea sp.]